MPGAWFLLLILVCLLGFTAQEFNLTLLHTGDIHARVEQYNNYLAACSPLGAADLECFGGMARLKTKIDELKVSRHNVLLLDAGDVFMGTLWFYFYRGQAMKYFMEQLGYDAMCLGNHEFDFGVSGLKAFLENITFSVLSANINSSGEPRMASVLPSVTLDIGGEKIGIIGYTTRDTRFLVAPAGIETISFLDEIESVQAEATRLSTSGVNKILALGHVGIIRDIELAQHVPEVDIIVGGHSHTFLYTGEPPSREEPSGPYPYVVTQASGKHVLIVHDHTAAKYLGHLDVTFDDQGDIINYSGNPILLDGSVDEDVDILEEVDARRAALEEFRNEDVGYSLVLLDGGAACEIGECNLGNLLLDATIHNKLLSETSDGSWTKYSVALWNSGGIRVPLAPGVISLGSLNLALPFSNTIQGIKINGTTLKKILEHSVVGYNRLDPRGRFLQYSGIRVSYNLAAVEGERVVEARVRCAQCTTPVFEPLDPHAQYDVLINDYMLVGGDGYAMIAEEMLELDRFGTAFIDALADYLRIRSPIIHGVEGRIRFTENGEMERREDGEKSASPCWAPTHMLLSVIVTLMLPLVTIK